MMILEIAMATIVSFVFGFLFKEAFEMYKGGE